MINPEMIQSTGVVINQAREVFEVTAKNNLLQNLTDSGHPYGLLLGINTASWPSILLCPSASSILSSQWSENSTAPDPVSSLPFFGSFLINFSIINSGMFESFLKRYRNYNPEHYDENRRVEVYDNANFGERLSMRFGFSSINDWVEPTSYGLILTSISKSGIKWLVKNNQEFNNLWNSQVVLAPGILKSLTEIGDRPRNLWVGRNQIGVGTSSIHLVSYRGETPYVIKSPAGEPLDQINPGETLGSVHVSGQANLLRNLSPLEKVEQITGDFIDLLKAIDHGGSPDLNEVQQKTVARASQATIIGISHLVRLFGRKTGLPTWKLDVLPELVQRFHQHDSQVVSKAFGGTRKVRVNDVEMMVVTPTMRQQLVAAF